MTVVSVHSSGRNNLTSIPKYAHLECTIAGATLNHMTYLYAMKSLLVLTPKQLNTIIRDWN